MLGHSRDATPRKRFQSGSDSCEKSLVAGGESESYRSATGGLHRDGLMQVLTDGAVAVRVGRRNALAEQRCVDRHVAGHHVLRTVWQPGNLLLGLRVFARPGEARPSRGKPGDIRSPWNAASDDSAK